jgi:hypothetical protein
MVSGWTVFALQGGDLYNCRSSDDAASTYNKYGTSTDCHRGTDGELGGNWANRVYRIGEV